MNNVSKKLLRCAGVLAPLAAGAGIMAGGINDIANNTRVNSDSGLVLTGLGAAIMVIWVAYLLARNSELPNPGGNKALIYKKQNQHTK